MPDIAGALKAEIKRISRKELRAEVAGLRAAIANLRSELSKLRKGAVAIGRTKREPADPSDAREPATARHPRASASAQKVWRPSADVWD